MFVFREIWHALFSCYLRFEVRVFALLPTKVNVSTQVYFRHLSIMTIARNMGMFARISTVSQSSYGVFSGPYFAVFGLTIERVFSSNTGNMDQKKLRIWTLFTQCMLSVSRKCFVFITNFVCLESLEKLFWKGNLIVLRGFLIIKHFKSIKIQFENISIQ